MRRLQSRISFLLASQIQVQIYGVKSCGTSVVFPLSGIVMDSRFLSYGKEKESRSGSGSTTPFGYRCDERKNSSSRMDKAMPEVRQ